MPFKKGEVANPKGRPTKGRALTEILTKAGNKNGRKQLLAELVWTFATTGAVSIDGRTYKAQDISDLMAAWKWIYQHIDGPAPSSVDVTSNGETITSPAIVPLPTVAPFPDDDNSTPDG